MDLLSAGEWGEFRSAIEDVTDTFFDMPTVLIIRSGRTLTPFHENREKDLNEAQFFFRTLRVENSSDESRSQAMIAGKGAGDFAQGYFLFYYKDLLNNDPSFINSEGKCTIIPNKDSIYAAGIEHTILSVNLVGPTETDYQLVKIQFKKQLSISVLNGIVPPSETIINNMTPVKISESTTLTNQEMIMVDCSDGPVELTLPLSDHTNSGKEYTAVKIDNTVNALIFKTSGGQLISGLPEKSVDTQWAGYKIKSTGTGYIVVSNI